MNKSVCFRTEMVKSILKGQKTVFRKVITPQPEDFGKALIFKDGMFSTADSLAKLGSPYQCGEFLYVKETWNDTSGNSVIYRADGDSANSAEHSDEPKWRSSRQMPQKYARIFLKITAVRAEHLQDILDASKEGVYSWGLTNNKTQELWCNYTRKADGINESVASSKGEFAAYWDHFIPKDKRRKIGWDANPWVWVIEFKRCQKPEEENNDY